MKISEMFSKPVDRQINPAVVVSKQDSATVNIEIEEYVFTQDLMENLYRFLNNFLNQEQDKTGIWINGYYGSGKSHFIKYVYYCLHPETSNKAFEHFIQKVHQEGKTDSDVTFGSVSELKRKIGKYEINTILFNIDAVSGQKNEKEKITKIFFNQFNGFRGYNSTNIQLATLVEKHLDQLGVFEVFKTRTNEIFKTKWEKDAVTLTSLKLAQVLEVLKTFDSGIDTDFLRAKLKNPDDITITDHLIPEFQEFLLNKPENYRLIFMVDEVSQYIGSNANLLLNLQTIIEELGSKCGNKIWLATTAQQTIDEVVQNAKVQGEDFGKILGRFETRIALSSQDADYITKKRILDKNSEAIKTLTQFYKTNKDAIINQFVFSHDLYKSYEKQEDFHLSYPFIPYQFRLISDVFESFSHLNYVIKEVRNNERSVLAITHFTVKKNKEKDLGYFIPFDAFFNELFERNLTHLARNIMERAISINEIKNDLFAQRVVKVLFMISNLTETKLLTFPPNLDNLTQILMDQVDINRLELQNKIQKVLDVLINKNIINEENGNYQFYKEDEIDVANLIQNQTITLDDRIQALYDDILEKMLSIQRKVSFSNNSFSIYLIVDGKEIYRNGDIRVLITAYDSESMNLKALNVSKTDLVVGINAWFFNDDSLKRDFEQYAKTKKYLKMNFDSAAGTRKRTIEKFGSQNATKLFELCKKFEIKFSETPFISAQQIIEPGDIKTQEPAKRFNEALQIHLKEVYKKNHLAVARTNDELKLAAASQQKSMDTTLTQGELLVDSYINQLGDDVTVDDVIKNFLRPPYGWKDNATINALLGLGKKNKRKFEWRNDPIDIKVFVEKALKTNERPAIVIKNIEEIGSDLIHAVCMAYRQIFNEDLRENHDAGVLYEEIKKQLSHKIAEVGKYVDDYYGSVPLGIHFHNFHRTLWTLDEIREPKKLFESLINDQQKMKELNDRCKENIDFIRHQISNYYTIKKFAEENKQNFSSLEGVDQDKADSLLDYLKTEDNPGERFPQFKKTYEELRQSLKTHINELQETAIKLYRLIFEELNEKAAENKVKDVYAIFNAGSFLNSIEKEKNIPSLKLKISEANSYKTTKFQEILDHKQKENAKVGIQVKETEILKIESKVIQTTDDLEQYLADLKKRILQKLAQNKIIIIE